MKVANCKNCNKEFTYKWHGRGNSCSIECTAIIVRNSKLKYTKEQIDLVVALKKSGHSNSDISARSNVRIGKVKEIIKESGLLLTKDERQSRAYNAKISKNPDAMTNMRSAYHKKTISEVTIQEVRDAVLSCGYEYVDGFKGKSKPFNIMCLRCKTVRETCKLNTIVKDTCGYCSGSIKTSAAEIEIKEWLESFGLKVEKYKFAERAGGIEIDVYLPDLKIGIEYCGLYWHNEKSPTPRLMNCHAIKLAKANRDGIRLITIFEDEWKNRKEQVKGFLASVVGKNSNRVFARKTELKSVSSVECRDFMNANHIQGYAGSDCAFGLFVEENLIAVISGNTHHRQGQESSYVLNRLAFKKDYSVIGGSSRLLKALISHAKLFGFKVMVSWSDNRWSEGRVYSEIGFTLDEILKPDYSYVTGQNRVSKQSCQKKHLLVRGGIGGTEREMADSLGYKRIWDCGKKRWTLSLE